MVITLEAPPLSLPHNQSTDFYSDYFLALLSSTSNVWNFQQQVLVLSVFMVDINGSIYYVFSLKIIWFIHAIVKAIHFLTILLGHNILFYWGVTTFIQL